MKKTIGFMATVLLILVCISGIKVSAKSICTKTVYEGEVFSISTDFLDSYDLNKITVEFSGNIIPDETSYNSNFSNKNIDWTINPDQLVFIACHKSSSNYIYIYDEDNNLIKKIKVKIKKNNYSGKGTFILQWSIQNNGYIQLDTSDYNNIEDMNSLLGIVFRKSIIKYEGELVNGLPNYELEYSVRSI